MTRITRLGDVSETRNSVTTGPERTLSREAPRRDDVAVIAPDGPNDVVRAGLREIVAARAALDRLEAALVVEGRKRGYCWAVLGAELGLTAHGARRRHLAVDPIYAWKRSRPPTPEEELRRFLVALDGKMRE